MLQVLLIYPPRNDFIGPASKEDVQKFSGTRVLNVRAAQNAGVKCQVHLQQSLLFIPPFLSFINQVNNELPQKRKKCVRNDKEAGKRWQAEKQKGLEEL